MFNFNKIIQIIKFKELRNKILFVFALLIIFRLAAHIPVPGVDIEKLREFFEGNQFFGLLNMFTGGGMENMSIVMLGVGPYITATIIMQLLTMIFPQIKEWYHESGEQGRQKFNQYTRYLTVPLAVLQGYAMISLLRSQGVVGSLDSFALASTIIVITAGTIFLMWLGELISEKGIGNGISLIIFAGIVAGFPMSFQQTIATYSATNIPAYVAFLILSIIVVAAIVIITEAQRNIPVSYAKRVRGAKMYGGVSTHLPLRVNSAGMIPIIFAMSIMLFPGMIATMLSHSDISWLANIANSTAALFENLLFYGILYFILVVLFTYFYTAVVFDPKAVSTNLQKQGGFVPGIRPGKPTAEFLYNVLNRITLVGAVFLGLIAVLPFIGQAVTHITTMVLGGAAILIVVGVVLDTVRQVQSQLAMREYENL
jgi:preprotein translocase subunit SecY